MAAQCLLRPKRVLFLALGHSSHCRTHGIRNAGLDPLLASFGCARTIRACLLFAQAAIRDIDLPRSVDDIFLQIGGNDFNSATCVPTQLARYILHVVCDSINLGGFAKVGICLAKSVVIQFCSIWLLLLYRTHSLKTYALS